MEEYDDQFNRENYVTVHHIWAKDGSVPPVWGLKQETRSDSFTRIIDNNRQEHVYVIAGRFGKELVTMQFTVMQHEQLRYAQYVDLIGKVHPDTGQIVPSFPERMLEEQVVMAIREELAFDEARVLREEENLAQHKESVARFKLYATMKEMAVLNMS
jgi:hypothetical protein